jgi:tellurite methyltransferase
MERAITGFELDEKGDWVAALSCGHHQHTRHSPPFQERPWVLTAEGRASQVGAVLDCLFCNMPVLPEKVRAYQQTKAFDENTVPAGLLKDHSTKAGTWARILVREGLLLYTIAEESWILKPGIVGIVEPEVAHHVTPRGEVSFHVEFLKRDS